MAKGELPLHVVNRKGNYAQSYCMPFPKMQNKVLAEAAAYLEVGKETELRSLPPTSLTCARADLLY